jgi:ABC-type polysaccharide/polyol phosphate transport system ATPase subunit
MQMKRLWFAFMFFFLNMEMLIMDDLLFIAHTSFAKQSQSSFAKYEKFWRRSTSLFDSGVNVILRMIFLVGPDEIRIDKFHCHIW